MGFVHVCICREPAVMHTSDQELTNYIHNMGVLYFMFNVDQRYFCGPMKYRWVFPMGSRDAVIVVTYDRHLVT